MLSSRNRLCCILSLIFILGLPFIAVSQDVKQYTGPLQVGKYKGKADYGYLLVENDTILDGTFQMNYSNPDALLSGKDNYFLFKGSFDNNIAEGFWQFQFGEFHASNEAEVVDYQYKVKVSGIEHEADGAIKKGKPHGKWTHTIHRLENSNIEDVLFKSTIQFDNGIPQRSFRIENESKTLLGRFLRDGLAHDVWELYSDDIPVVNEKWYFNEGLLEKILFIRNGQIDTLNVYSGNLENAKAINLDEQYIQILKVMQQMSDAPDVELKDNMSSILNENATNYKKIDDILSTLGESDFTPEFKVKAVHYPFKKGELAQFESIQMFLEKSEAISHSILDDSQLNILRLANEEVSYLYAIVSEISGTFLKPLSKVSEYQKFDILDFIPRENLVAILWPEGKPKTTIDVNYEGADGAKNKSFTGPQSEKVIAESKGTPSTYQLAHYAFRSLDSIKHILTDRLFLHERREELVDLEEKLVTQMTGLDELIDSLSVDAAEMSSGALQSVKAGATKELSKYSAMEDMATKPDQARQLITCLDQMNELAVAVSKLPEQGAEIKKEYTERVWNPFTATLMNEEAKRRITAAYDNVLIPYILNGLKSELNCDKAPEFKILLENVHERMLQMKKEDTSKIERKLKKEQDPQAVMQLFNIQTIEKES